MILTPNVVPQVAGIVAGMLSLAIKTLHSKNTPKEEEYELKNSNLPSRTFCLHLSSTIYNGSGETPSGKYRASICVKRQSVDFRMASSSDQNSGQGFRDIWDSDEHPGGFQDSHRRDLFKQSRGSFCAGSLETIKIVRRLAPTFGTLLINRYTNSR
jgi:hypothetical protein